ncbi:sensor histidine kinase [Kineococcus gynurae]|uniref:histidine kinase n=1 Tax=Kineococcus gynurae TaxID=452979 RepID=A0ABV5LNS2_9ACTN
MTPVNARRLVLLTLVLSMLSTLPGLSTASALAVGRQAPAWTVAVAVSGVAVAARLGWLLRDPGPSLRGPGLLLLVWGDLALLTHALLGPPVGTEPPWVLGLSPLTMAAGALAFGLRGGLIAGLAHCGLRVLHDVLMGPGSPATQTVVDLTLLLVVAPMTAVASQAMVDAADGVGRARARLAEATAEAAAVAARAAAEARWDAIVHDEVLATLGTVAAARTRQDRRTATRAAAGARAQLGGDTAPSAPPASSVAVGLLARDLNRMARRQRVQLVGVAPPTTGARVGADVAEAVTVAAAEALRNVARHAGRPDGSVPTVHLEVVPGPADTLVVDVADDGVGFDPDRSGGRGLGLAVSIRGRMASVGGSATITSRRGEGTRVRLRVPTLPGPETSGVPSAPDDPGGPADPEPGRVRP